MDNLVIDLCKKLELSNEADVSELMHELVFCFEAFQKVNLDDMPEGIAKREFTKEEIVALKAALTDAISNKNPDAIDIGSMVWAYGKIADEGDKTFLNNTLKSIVGSNNANGAYQAMCVLDSLGESILGPSSSMFDEQKNLDKARDYLH